MNDQRMVTYDWAGLAAQLAAFPGLAETIRAEHVADRTGHCPRCRHQQNGSAPVHPCRLHDVAGMAITLRRAGR